MYTHYQNSQLFIILLNVAYKGINIIYVWMLYFLSYSDNKDITNIQFNFLIPTSHTYFIAELD